MKGTCFQKVLQISAGAVLFAVALATIVVSCQGQQIDTQSSKDQKSAGEIVDEYVEKNLEALNLARQRSTLSRVMALGRATDMFIMDNPGTGSPKAGDIGELVRVLNAAELLQGSNFVKDGWGNAFIYKADPRAGGYGYTIISHGADGAPGPEQGAGGEAARFDEDIVWTNGRFTREPGNMR